MTIRQFLLACFCCVTPCLTAQTSKIKLSEMNLSPIYQPYGTPASGKAVTGEPLQVAGTLFADGVGVQANSKIKISLQGKSSLFTCKIGINDQSVNYKDSHLAKIPLTDGTMLFYDQTNGRKQYVGIRLWPLPLVLPVPEPRGPAQDRYGRCRVYQGPQPPLSGL